MRIGTWNTRGLLEESKLKALERDLNRYNLDILTVQETHRRGTDRILIGKNYTLYHTGPTTHSHHGVGIIVKNQYKGNFRIISDRICHLDIELSNRDKLTIIAAYAPTLTNSNKNPSVADNFYTDLQNSINSLPNRNHIFIGIDSNAQLGTGKDNIFPNNVGNFGKGNLNSNGERLGQFIVNNNLIATNTFFDHKLKHRVTWHHPDKNPKYIDKKSGLPRRNPIRNQIDFILTKQKLKPLIQDSRSYCGTETESDHNLVICKCSEIKPYKIYKENKDKPQKLNLENLKNKEIKTKYQKELETKLEDIDITQTNWTDVAKIIKETAKDTLGTNSNKQKSQPNIKIQELSKELHKLKLEKESCKNPQLIKEINTKRNKTKKNIKNEIKKDKENAELKRIEDIEKFKDDSRCMFQAVRVLSKKEDSNIIIHNSKGEIIHSIDEELLEITKYFENIFKQEDITPLPELQPQQLEIEINSEEVKLAVDKLKNNKSPGCDQINTELIKNSPYVVYEHIAEILNEIAETGVKPLELSLGQLIPLPKPGKPKGPVKNLRPVILQSILRNILAIIVVDRTFKP